MKQLKVTTTVSSIVTIDRLDINDVIKQAADLALFRRTNYLFRMKKLYIKPITESFPMIMEDFTTNSVEYYKEYIDDGDDWGDSVIIDPGEEIDW